MLIYKKLTIYDKEKLEYLIKTIKINSSNNKWWLPINKILRDHFFDDDWTYFLGLFDDEKLIGASALFLNKHEFEESLSHCKNVILPVAKIGRSMILPEYRENLFIGYK